MLLCPPSGSGLSPIVVCTRPAAALTEKERAARAWWRIVPCSIGAFRLLRPPARSPETRPGLALEDEGDDFGVAFPLCASGAGCVKRRAGVPRAVRAESCYFEGAAVVEVAAGRPADDCDAAEASVFVGCEAPLVADDFAVVPVQLLDVGVGLSERSLADLDHLLRQLWPVRVMPLHISMSRSMVARAVMLSWLSRGVMRSIRASVS